MANREPLAISKRIFPPHWLLLLFFVELALHRFAPVARVVPRPLNYLGVLFLVAAVALGGSAFRLFRRAGTEFVPFRKSTALVIRGPYRFTRNPMYLGMAFVLLGTAVLLGTLTPFISVVVFVVLIQFLFILPEEALMERTFGASYIEFKHRVRRWL